MILSLPQELVCMIAELCSLGGQASLSRSCRRLCEICIPILYRNDVKNYRSSSVFHAIVHSRDERDTLAILAAAKANGADFKRCQDARKYHPLSLYHLDATLHSPLRLAARRGRDDVMSFLLDHGLPPDGPGDMDTSKKTPLMEAIVSHQESTAILLVRRGASIGLRPPNLEAFKAAVRGDLVCLVRVIVEREDLDVNAEVGHGCTPLVLAVCYRREQMIRALLSMGAQAMPAMRQFCRNHAFVSILWMLDSGSMLMSETLSIDDILELAALITTQRASPVHKNQQVLALERFLELLDKTGPWDCSSSVRSARQPACFLDALLQMVLSIDHTNKCLATLLLRKGARIHSGVFSQLLETLNSPIFNEDKVRCLRRHRGLLHCFDFVYSHLLSSSAQSRQSVGDDFLEHVPDNAVLLVWELKQRGMPLTASGLEAMGRQKLENE